MQNLDNIIKYNFKPPSNRLFNNPGVHIDNLPNRVQIQCGALRQLMNKLINRNTNASTLKLHEMNASTRFIAGKTNIIVIYEFS